MGVRRKRHPEEFKADAVELLRTSDEPLAMVAQRLGVNHWTLRDWYRASDVTRKPQRATPVACEPELAHAGPKLARLHLSLVRRVHRASYRLKARRGPIGRTLLLGGLQSTVRRAAEANRGRRSWHIIRGEG